MSTLDNYTSATKTAASSNNGISILNTDTKAIEVSDGSNWLDYTYDFIALYPYLIDAVSSSSESAYSLRQLSSSATNCIRVRRSSDDTEQDIGFSSNALDTSSLTNFVGAND